MPPMKLLFPGATGREPPGGSGEGGALCTVVMTLISKEPINTVSKHPPRLSLTRPSGIVSDRPSQGPTG